MLEQFQLVRLRMQPLGLWVRLHREWIWKFQRKRSHLALPLGLHVQLVHKLHGPDRRRFRFGDDGQPALRRGLLYGGFRLRLQRLIRHSKNAWGGKLSTHKDNTKDRLE